MKNSNPVVLGMILKGFPRISETFISNEILLLERMGFKIRLISMRRPREPFTHESVKQIQARVDYLPSTISGNVRVLLRHNLRVAARRPRAYAGALLMALKRYARTRKTATFKHLLQGGYVVDKILPGSGISHFHAHFAHSPTSVALFAGRLSGLPFSFTAHAKDIYTSDPRQLAEKIDRADFVVTCTEYNRRHLTGLAGNSGTPVHRVYHGIDLGLFAGNGDNLRPRRPYKVLTVARMTAKKGLPVVYQALRVLKDQGFEIEHTLIGDGDDRDEILALMENLGLKDSTVWMGTQPHHVVLEQYRRSDLFVLGCRIADNGDRDGIPNVILEAMAMGVPVAATEISAIPEAVEHEKTGLLVPPNDPQALARAMARLLTDQELRSRIIPEARRRVSGGFDNQALINDLAGLYRNASGLRPGAPG